MNSWKVILATMVIFGAGVVTGGLLVLHSESIRAPRVLRGAGLNRPGQPLSAGLLRIEFLRRAGRELDLTPQQRERLDQIVKASQERTRKAMAPYLRVEIQNTEKDIREVLTPEQRTRFDQLLKQQQQQQQQRAREQRRLQPPAERPPEAAPAAPKQ